jgi:hypothetical protein
MLVPQRSMAIRRSFRRSVEQDMGVEPELEKLLLARPFNEDIPHAEVSVIGENGGVRHARVALEQAIAEAQQEGLDGMSK